MKHVFALLTIVIFMAASSAAAFPDSRTAVLEQEYDMTLKSQMEFLHRRFGVNFVYDSAIEINVPYSGKPMKDLLRGMPGSDRTSLELCLQTIFAGTGIEYEIMKKYIVLTQADKRKKPKDYTIFIEEQHDTISESVITAILDPKRNTTQTGLKRIDSRDLNSGFAFFSTPDVIKTLQMLPGVASGTELLSGFYVHGGDGTDNLFLLDGVPIYQVSHLLGMFSSFNTDVISNLDFYKSGFPARFGSKLSSVVDVTTKDGDFNEYHGTFALGLIDGRLQLEGPLWKGKTSFNVGLRRTWTETVTLPFFAIINKRDPYGKVNARYAFTDLNAKVTHKFSDTNVLSANFYSGRDYFGYRGTSISRYTDGVTDDYIEETSILDLGLAWGNIIGSLNWDYKIDDAVSVRNIAYYSGSLSDLHFYNHVKDQNDNQSKSGEYNTSNVHNLGLKSDFHHVLDSKHKLRYGTTLQYHIYCPSATAKTDAVIQGIEYTQIAYADSLRYNAVEAALYAEDEMKLTDDLAVNVGLRYGLYSAQRKVWHSLEPRVAMRYSFNKKVSIKASYTEMSQPAHLISSLYLDLPTNAWLPSTQRVRPSRSREVAGGIYTELAYNLHLNVEGWYKRMNHLLEYAGAYNMFPPLTGWESNYKSGIGRSWGTEIDFGFDNGRTEANVYYTLSWSQRKFEDFYPDWYRDRNDNRHKLTIMARHKFGKRFELYGAWNYHSGNRITMATHSIEGTSDYGYSYDNYIYTEPNNVKLPDYHRLDLGLNFIKNTKRGNTSIWNLSIYNAYCRTNPIAADMRSIRINGEVISNHGEGGGIIPIIPTFSYTLKF